MEIGAVSASGGLTSLLKQAVGRERPDGSNNNSFPSGHSTGAFSCAALGGQNVKALSLPQWQEYTLRGGFLVMATGTAWARVEAKKHYPSDVLAGAALGNFVSRFIYDSFMGLDGALNRRGPPDPPNPPNPIDVSVIPSRDGVMIGLTAPF